MTPQPWYKSGAWRKPYQITDDERAELEAYIPSDADTFADPPPRAETRSHDELERGGHDSLHDYFNERAEDMFGDEERD